MPMTNAGNRFIYRLWAPIYDATVNQFFLPDRRRALAVLARARPKRLLTSATVQFIQADAQAALFRPESLDAGL